MTAAGSRSPSPEERCGVVGRPSFAHAGSHTGGVGFSGPAARERAQAAVGWAQGSLTAEAAWPAAGPLGP